MQFPRMPIEAESPEQFGYDKIKFNLTESSVRDRTLGDLGVDLRDLTLAYTDHLGHPGLRALLAQRAGGGLSADNVLITAGAASALFTVAITLLDRGDHIVVVRPNYATNIVTPRVLGCEISYLDLSFEEGFALDVGKLKSLVRANTKLISVTTPHNPTGVALSAEQLAAIVTIADAVGAHVLVDETYREMSFASKPPVATHFGERVISVASLSKSYGIPGIRLGWILCRDAALNHRLLCAKEQIGICGSIVDEEIGFHAVQQSDAWLARNDRAVRDAFAIVKTWMAQEERLEWVEPSGGCVCFPRLRDAGADTAKFYARMNELGAFVGPGHWFEQSDRYFRLGYGWPTLDELRGGLEAISRALRAN
ncbi:MAG: aminotransferase class I/II-fold pyridoxal phosphate-dependent enzyme [Terricaulis sp.]